MMIMNYVLLSLLYSQMKYLLNEKKKKYNQNYLRFDSELSMLVHKWSNLDVQLLYTTDRFPESLSDLPKPSCPRALIKWLALYVILM